VTASQRRHSAHGNVHPVWRTTRASEPFSVRVSSAPVTNSAARDVCIGYAPPSRRSRYASSLSTTRCYVTTTTAASNASDHGSTSRSPRPAQPDGPGSVHRIPEESEWAALGERPDCPPCERRGRRPPIGV
jgi:hypothetical protein